MDASSSTSSLSHSDASGDGAPDPLDGPSAGEVTMSFLDHLEEFRWSLLKGFAGLLGGVLLCSLFSEWIIDTVLLGPTHEDFFMYRLLGLDAKPLVLLNRTITGQFFAHVGTVAAVGVIVGSPVFVYFLWKFVEPGLYPNEKRGMGFAAAFATLFFTLGILFGYLIITPLALQFFSHYVISEQIVNEFDISRYFSMITFWAFGVGVLFELPVVMYFLARTGLATPDALRQYRRYALIVVLVLGAFFTPPDPVSQLLVALPLLLLYEFSIYVAVWAARRRRTELASTLSEGDGQ